MIILYHFQVPYKLLDVGRDFFGIIEQHGSSTEGVYIYKCDKVYKGYVI